ncbi:MAG: hypothetical protein JNK85_06750 [Verrucomicrobiales bacterium]|nr:hypothetical protein [Verrucomicrobiales bacterium]
MPKKSPVDVSQLKIRPEGTCCSRGNILEEFAVTRRWAASCRLRRADVAK